MVMCNTHYQVDFRHLFLFFSQLHTPVCSKIFSFNFFLSNATITNYFTIFLQIADIGNSHRLRSEFITNIIFFTY